MPDDDLLTTTEAAKLLHCSRQHVVDMCDRGELPSVRPGSHRRIPRREVEAFLVPPPRREDLRSLWLNYALAAKLVQDPPGVIERAKARLEQLRRTHSDGHSDRYFDGWQEALDAGPDAVLALMAARTEWGQVMRSASPMSGLGLLDSEERTRILDAVREYWNSTHGGDEGVSPAWRLEVSPTA